MVYMLWFIVQYVRIVLCLFVTVDLVYLIYHELLLMITCYVVFVIVYLSSFICDSIFVMVLFIMVYCSRFTCYDSLVVIYFITIEKDTSILYIYLLNF